MRGLDEGRGMTPVYDAWQAALVVGFVLESGTNIGSRLKGVGKIGEEEESEITQKKK